MNLEIGKVYVMEPVDHAAAVRRFASYPITSCWQNVYTGLDIRIWRYVGDNVFEWVDDPSIRITNDRPETVRFVEANQ